MSLDQIRDPIDYDKDLELKENIFISINVKQETETRRCFLLDLFSRKFKAHTHNELVFSTLMYFLTLYAEVTVNLAKTHWKILCLNILTDFLGSYQYTNFSFNLKKFVLHY